MAIQFRKVTNMYVRRNSIYLQLMATIDGVDYYCNDLQRYLDRGWISLPLFKASEVRVRLPDGNIGILTHHIKNKKLVDTYTEFEKVQNEEMELEELGLEVRQFDPNPEGLE